MENNEIKEKIRQDMDAFDVPDSLSPEEVEKKLEHTKQRKRFFAGNRKKGLIAACAAFVVLLSAGTFALSQRFFTTDSTRSGSSPQSGSNAVAESGTKDSSDTSYKEISELINEYNNEDRFSIVKSVDGAIPEGAEVEDSADLQENTGDMAKKNSNSTSSSSSGTASPSYSETDTQVDGVMEGDIVKTDGSHIFAVKSATTGFQIKIYDVNGANVKKAETLLVDQMDCKEMYVKGTILILVCQNWDSLRYTESNANEKAESIGPQTVIYLYDISDASSPKEICHHTQDGYFETSRLTDDFLYTFSYFSTGNSECDPKHPEDYVPLTDGKALKEDEILLMEKSAHNSYMVMTSLNVSDNKSFADKGAAFGGSDVYYMSNNNIYFVNRGYSIFSVAKDGRQDDKTSILKYSYDKGKFTYVADTKVRGEISDSYYMHEYQGNFIFVYTKYGKTGKTNNGLCIMDENLKLTGEIDGLGKNETIYSSYYIDNMAYFVTYRNTDPVFAVDISDPKKPVLKSELKLPGFSDYLHSFRDNTLLGIGRGGKNESSIKFSLFSISDDKELNEIAKTKLSGGTYCLAGSNHHAVFIDEECGLVGLGVESEKLDENDIYSETYTYEVYQYKDKKFTKVLSCPILYSYESLENVRGLRIGEYFYVVDVESGVTVFDINTWKKAK